MDLGIHLIAKAFAKCLLLEMQNKQQRGSKVGQKKKNKIKEKVGGDQLVTWVTNLIICLQFWVSEMPLSFPRSVPNRQTGKHEGDNKEKPSHEKQSHSNGTGKGSGEKENWEFSWENPGD